MQFRNGEEVFFSLLHNEIQVLSRKVLLLFVPRDEARLNLWRRAISRKYCLLQVNDYVCERHFILNLVCKTWASNYNGQVLVSSPRCVSLVRDTVPTKFPRLPFLSLKNSKKQEAARGKAQLVAPAKRKIAASHVSNSRKLSDDDQSVYAQSTHALDHCMNAIEGEEQG